LTPALTQASRRFLLLTVLADFVLVNLSFFATSLTKFGVLYPTDNFLPMYVKLQVVLNVAVPLALVLTGAYRDVDRAPLGHQAVSCFKACLWVSAGTLAVLYGIRHLGYSRVFVVAHLTTVAVLLPVSRMLISRLAEAARARGVGVRPVVLAGERESVSEVGLHLRLASHLGYRIAGLCTVGWQTVPEQNGSLAILRDPESLRRFLAEEAIERVFVCDTTLSRERYKSVIEAAREAGSDARLIVTPVVVPDYRTRIHDLLAVPLLVRQEAPSAPASSRLKRLLDVAICSLLLLLASPLIGLAALLVKLDSPGPVFFKQRRLGQSGRPFELIKFRSMRATASQERSKLNGSNEATGPLFKMKEDPRVTRVGHWLRRFSLDELPQLWNVLRGEMSLVGPRPPLPEEAAAYENWQKLRLEAPQGLTGLWQVSGRSRVGFDEMVLLDLHYIENWSFLLDLEILLETVPTMLHGDGAY
jgi:exopolysaccharide biosynthesis polyprenyl glycosylphosphotransferase